MMMPQRANTRHLIALVVLLFLLVGAPLLLWVIAAYTHITVLVVPILFWIGLPASLFGAPLFKLTMVGYDPVGIAGWSMVVLFYVAIAFVLWGAILVALWLRRRRAI
jgi:hypothetical protein